MRTAIPYERILSEEQEMLRRGIGSFFEREYDRHFMRNLISDFNSYSRKLLPKLASQGLLGVIIPPDYNGLGLTMFESSLICELAGQHLAPGWFSTTTFLGCSCLVLAGSGEQKEIFLPKISDGKLMVSMIFPQDLSLLSEITFNTFRYQRVRGGYELYGGVGVTVDAPLGDYFLVPASLDDGSRPTLFMVKNSLSGIRLADLEFWDLSRRALSVELNNVHVDEGDSVGKVGEGDKALLRSIPYILVALSAELVGISQRLLDMTIEHLSTRLVFDRPAGSYQALKHRCTDLLMGIENSRSLVLSAAAKIDESSSDSLVGALAAKSYCGPVAIRTALEAIQLHGGAGFTWDSDIHLYLRRAKADEELVASSREAKLRLADLQIR